jgi:hypothetical protein
MSTSGRIRTEEFHGGLLCVKFPHGISDKFVFDMAFCIHDETVITETTTFGWPRQKI